jgi:putative DNA primase/helicase
MTEAINKVEAVGAARLPEEPVARLLALYEAKTETADIEAVKLTFEMIEQTSAWRKLGLKEGGDEGKAAVKSAEIVRDFWLRLVAKNVGEEEAEEFGSRWAEAFKKAEREAAEPKPKPKEVADDDAANLNAAIAREAEPKPQAQAEEAQPEPEVAEPEAWKAKIPAVAFSFDPPIADAEPAVLSHAASFDNAREFARRRCWKAGSLSVYAWGGKFWEWNERSYYQMEEAALKASVYTFLDGSLKRTNDGPARFRPKPRHVTELLDGLRAGLALPAWCGPPMRLDTGERAGDVLMFRNGLVEILSGSLVAPTPKLWVHDSVEYDWDPDAECPQWLGFLEGIFPGDQEAKDCLEEFLGLSQTEDVSFQKGLMAIGPPRSGKGTTLRISEWLGGTRAFISLDLDKWVQNENSGEGMIGKKVLAFPDVRLKEGKWYGQNFDPGGVDYKSVQRLLKITTADMITLGRKYIGPWEGVLPGKVWWLSNKIPNFNDWPAPGLVDTRLS